MAIVTGGWVLGLRMNRESPGAMGVKSSESTSPGLRGASVTVQSATENSVGGGVATTAEQVTISKKASSQYQGAGRRWFGRAASGPRVSWNQVAPSSEVVRTRPWSPAMYPRAPLPKANARSAAVVRVGTTVTGAALP